MDKNATPRTGARKPSRKMAYAAFCLAAISCFLGLSLCLVKSPQARSQSYVAIAVTSLDDHRPHDAAAAALAAVRLNPMEAKGWNILSQILLQMGDGAAAAQARNIALRVQQNPDDATPVYAAAAELRLGLLASSEPQVP